MCEIFKQCDYLPIGYLIGNLGNVQSPSNKILKKAKSNSGYECINIRNKGYFIHRAISFAYISKPLDKDFINHKDGNKLNNKIENLEWCTKSENTKHAYEQGLKKKSVSNLYKGKFGHDHNRSKKVICRETQKEFGSMSEAERFYKLGSGGVSWSVKNKKPIFGMHWEIAL